MISHANKQILKVSDLTRSARQLLETAFSSIWVEGEISNFVRPASGHWYFSLKDEKSQARCAMFRGNNLRVKFQPKDGMHVLVRAKVSLYEGRGDFQLIVDHVEEVGFGALQRAFEQLKIKLDAEGLFDKIHKKPLPAYPKQIGVITSNTGAAIRDILNVLKRRYSIAPVLIYPTLVQGADAAAQIVKAIKIANQRQECDVLILTRGGGSLEDLWPFNEEIVARAIFDSTIPIVSGVGHEVDFTISDFVADHRAPTPSAAAELISPNKDDLIQKNNYYQQQLTYAINQHIQTKRHQLDLLLKRLERTHPKQILEQQSQQLDRLQQRLIAAQKNQLQQKKAALQSTTRALDIASPLATLARGYSILTDKKGKTITDAKKIKPGDKIHARLAKGELDCVVSD